MKTTKLQKSWWWRNPEGLPFTYDEKTGTTTPKEWISWPCLGLVHAKPTGPLVGLKYPGTPFWHDGLERNAFAYELARRADRRRRLPAFVALSQSEQDFIHGTFYEGTDLRWTHEWSNPITLPTRPGYSDRGVSWNLSESNDALAQSFIEWIEQQRIKHGVPTRKPHTRTKNQKRVQWNFLELIDKAESQRSPDWYGDPQRSRKSKALDEARKHLATLQTAMRNLPPGEPAFPHLMRAL